MLEELEQKEANKQKQELQKTYAKKEGLKKAVNRLNLFLS